MPVLARSRRVSRVSCLFLLALFSGCSIEDDGHVLRESVIAPNGTPPVAATGAFPIRYDQADAERAAAAFRQMVGSAIDEGEIFIDPFKGGLILTYRTWIEETLAYEYYSLFAPSNPGLTPRPLMVAFHGASTTHLDIRERTELFDEAAARGWYLLAPVQFSTSGSPPDISYGSAQTQLHVESVLETMIEQYPVDEERIYGVGFSMGGGACLSYAARHRDLTRPGVFAATVNHTGSVALSHVYDSSPQGSVQAIFELLFGGSPTASPFPWQQSSLIVLDSLGALVSGAPHFATNLATTPVQTWFNGRDLNTYLQHQSLELDAYLTSIGSQSHSLIQVDITDPTCLRGHCWAALDQQLACDWLAQQTLAPFAPSGQILIDRSGGWEVFEVDQHLFRQFSSLTYSVSATQSQIDLLEISNVSSIGFGLEDIGLTPSAGSSIKIDTAQDVAELVVSIHDVPQAPIAVYLDGTLLPEDCTSTGVGDRWCFDAASGRVELQSGARMAGSWRMDF